MNMRKKLLIAGIIVLTLAVAAGLFAYTGGNTGPGKSVGQAAEVTGTVSLTVEGLYENKSVLLSENATVLTLLQTLNATDPQLKLSTKVYAGLGTLIDGMHKNKNGTGGNYWQYKVNGVMPQIGADQFKPKNGDAILWYFGQSAL